MKKLPVFALAIGLLLAGTIRAETLVEIDHLRDGDLESVGFELKKGAEVDIEVLGIRTSNNSRLSAYAWLIDSKTRKSVWEMTSSRSERYRGNRHLRLAEKSIFLEPGKYELYMFAESNVSSYISDGKAFWGVIEGIVDSRDDRYDDDDFDDLIRDCYARISSDELTSSDISTFEVTGLFPNALFTFNRAGDDEYIRQGFQLDEPMNLHIYAVNEHPKGYKSPVDYGWIINADNREKVWEMDRWNTERAGGDRKNRVFDDEVRLEAGKYILYYATDGSHSFDHFNVNPPTDPYNWGITLLPGKDFKSSKFKLIDPPEEGEALIDFTRARDNDYLEQAFNLKKDGKIIIHAIGEYGNSRREFADYGWIVDASNGRIIWEMNRRNTFHAGGADKNRAFEGDLDLPAGKYVAYYSTDDSHAYRDWNSSPPYDAQSYGMSIFVGPGLKKADVELISEAEARDGSEVLVEMTRVGDNFDRRKHFTLDKPTSVRIYAIGEGVSGRMYDYGWIENQDSRDWVWEMTWRNTHHAGGADKNREFDGTIMLDAGEYVVYFVSDGSHSFNDWNDTRPHDPRNWGITVSVDKDQMAGR